MTDQASKTAVLEALDALYHHVASTAENDDDLAMADKVLDVIAQVEPLLDALREITALAGEPIPIDTQRRAWQACSFADAPIAPAAAAKSRADRVFADNNRAALAARGRA